MLGIHVGRFTRRDSEELRVELVQPLYESTASRDGFARHAGLGIIESLDIPAVGWNLGDRLTAFDEKFPK